jgi:glutamate/tyrosine decarboxylase-like PLP-dependent enzyme
MSAGKFRITLEDGSTVEVTDGGDANLTPSQEEHYAEVADEVMALPEPLAHARRGRPALDPGVEGKSPSISFRIPAATRDAADDLARSRGFSSAASLARHLLEHEVADAQNMTGRRAAKKRSTRRAAKKSVKRSA